MEHHDHASTRRHAREEHGRRVHEIRRAEGGRTDEEQDARMVNLGVHEHEGAMHPGKPKTKLKLADGGCADGGRSRRRMDRAHRAMGGRSGHMGRGKGSHVNVIVAPGQGPARPVPVPVPAAGAGGPPMLPSRPPMGPPVMAGGMPPGVVPGAGAPGMMPPGIRRAGGRVGRREGGRNLLPPVPKTMIAGGHSGEGRLEKSRELLKKKSAAFAGD
jgi:hypothetical protein